MITKNQLCAAMTKECDIAVHPFGKVPPDSYDYRPSPKQRSLLNGPLKWLTGYELQLVMYAKASGNETIGTANVWGGFDWPPPKES